MSGFSTARGDARAAVAVMQEAAQWLARRGMPLWTAAELERLPALHPAENFLVLYAGDTAAAAALLTFVDPRLWPEIPPASSGCLHKVSVRRVYAGQGLALRLLEYAAQVCREAGCGYLRLDCDAARPKLIALYEAAGFTLAGVRTVRTAAHGEVTAARFAKALRQAPQTCDSCRSLV